LRIGKTLETELPKRHGGDKSKRDSSPTCSEDQRGHVYHPDLSWLLTSRAMPNSGIVPGVKNRSENSATNLARSCHVSRRLTRRRSAERPAKCGARDSPANGDLQLASAVRELVMAVDLCDEKVNVCSNACAPAELHHTRPPTGR
jgi:hypothetical protein